MAKNSGRNPRSFSELYPNECSLAVRRRRILEKFWTSGIVQEPPAVTVCGSSRVLCGSSILSSRSIHRHPSHLYSIKGSQITRGCWPTHWPHPTVRANCSEVRSGATPSGGFVWVVVSRMSSPLLLLCLYLYISTCTATGYCAVGVLRRLAVRVRGSGVEARKRASGSGFGV